MCWSIRATLYLKIKQGILSQKSRIYYHRKSEEEIAEIAFLLYPTPKHTHTPGNPDKPAVQHP